MSPKRKVLIIDDSAVARKALSSICSQSEELEVVGTAPDAMVGLRKIESLQPDVITLDVEMPGMDGLTFLEKLMKSDPLPVVMVSAYTESGSSAALRALELFFGEAFRAIKFDCVGIIFLRCAPSSLTPLNDLG